MRSPCHEEKVGLQAQTGQDLNDLKIDVSQIRPHDAFARPRVTDYVG